MKKWITRNLVKISEAIICRWGDPERYQQDDIEMSSSDIRVVARDYVLDYKKNDLSPNPPYDVVFRRAAREMDVWKNLGEFLDNNGLIEKEFLRDLSGNLKVRIRLFIYTRFKKRK